MCYATKSLSIGVLKFAVCFYSRLRGSRVLLVGLGGLGAEVAKNLILAGVKGLTMLDHEKVYTHRWSHSLHYLLFYLHKKKY